MPNYSVRSESRLLQCSPKIQLVFRNVIKVVDNTILTGHRTEFVQNKKFYAKPQQSKVKWPNGKHNSIPSQAIDAAPWPIPENWGENHWKDKVKFYQFASIVMYEAEKLGIALRWGGDWDGDGNYKDQTFDDLVHFEELNP